MVEICTAENRVLSCNFGGDPSFMKRTITQKECLFRNLMTHRGFVNVNGGGVPRLMRKLQAFVHTQNQALSELRDESGRVDPYIPVCLARRSDVRIAVSSSLDIEILSSSLLSTPRMTDVAVASI